MSVKICNKCYHIMKKGETVEEVCKMFKIEKDKLLEYNGYAVLNAGDIAILPSSYNLSYVVQPFDTKEKISEKLKLPIEVIEKSLKNEKLFIGKKIFFYFD